MAFFEDTEKLDSPYDIFMFDSNLYSVSYRAHWHYYIGLLYMYDGQVTVECDNKPYVLNPGDFLIIMPRVIHSFYSDYTGHISYGVVKFNPINLNFSNKAATLVHAVFSGAIPATQFPVYLPASETDIYTVGNIIDRLISEAARKDLYYTDYVNSLLSMLIISIMRFWQKKNIKLNSVVGQSTASSEIFTVLEYISNHSGEPIAVPDLAKQCNMSYSTFSRLFKQQTGRSCKEYIEYIRISKAQDLLLFTDKPLNYIACETGFVDSSHFIKTYKKLFGITPAQQRKSLPSGFTSSTDIKP